MCSLKSTEAVNFWTPDSLLFQEVEGDLLLTPTKHNVANSLWKNNSLLHLPLKLVEQMMWVCSTSRLTRIFSRVLSTFRVTFENWRLAWMKDFGFFLWFKVCVLYFKFTFNGCFICCQTCSYLFKCVFIYTFNSYFMLKDVSTEIHLL